MGDDDTGLFDVIVQDGGDRPNLVAKVVQRATSVSNTRSRELVNAAPQIAIPQISKIQAEALKIELEGLGASILLSPSEGPLGK
jgi:ribosomal protein L7/L12